MPIIVKPFTFTGSLTPLLSWLDADLDALYTIINNGLDDANIKTNAGIQQSKIAGLVQSLSSVPTLDGTRAYVGNIWARSNGAAALRLTGLETNGKDFLFAESVGELIIMANDGTESVPSWRTIYGFRHNGIPSSGRDVATKDYVDDRTSDLGIAEAAFTASPDFTVAASGSFATVPGFSAGIVLSGNHRVRVHTQLSGISSTDPNAVVAFLISANGAVIGASQIEVKAAAGFATHSFFSDVLVAGGYTFTLQWKTDAGTATMRASGDAQARMQIEEMSQ